MPENKKREGIILQNKEQDFALAIALIVIGLMVPYGAIGFMCLIGGYTIAASSYVKHSNSPPGERESVSTNLLPQESQSKEREIQPSKFVDTASKRVESTKSVQPSDISPTIGTNAHRSDKVYEATKDPNNVGAIYGTYAKPKIKPRNSSQNAAPSSRVGGDGNEAGSGSVHEGGSPLAGAIAGVEKTVEEFANAIMGEHKVQKGRPARVGVSSSRRGASNNGVGKGAREPHRGSEMATEKLTRLVEAEMMGREDGRQEPRAPAIGREAEASEGMRSEVITERAVPPRKRWQSISSNLSADGHDSVSSSSSEEGSISSSSSTRSSGSGEEVGEERGVSNETDKESSVLSAHSENYRGFIKARREGKARSEDKGR